MKKFIPLIIALISLLAPVFMPSCANTTQAPSGGKKDTIPPYIVDIKPLPGETFFPLEKGKIVFVFNEYVNIKAATDIYLSPPLEKRPKAKIVGKSLVITFENPLEPNTTYTLNLNGAIADNNEGNKFPGFTYVFSTGEHIDSMFVTGTVLDCNTLAPMKGVTVMLYKDHSDSAVFLTRPYAAGKTDDWGYFVLPYIQDTLYRMYAVKDAGNDNLYSPDADRIAFIDSLIRPEWKVADSIPELLKYDMTDTLGCQERRSQYELKVFRERPTKQYIVNKVRTSPRSAYITFMAQDAWIDSLWFGGYPADRVISQFNLQQDSLELWLNDRRPAPDTIHLFVNYRKTDSLGVLKPELEHIKLVMDPEVKKNYSKSRRKNLKHEDTICVFTLKAEPEMVETDGFVLEFKNPIIYENFDSLKFRYLNPKQKEFFDKVEIERDSLNLRKYNIRPKVKIQPGFEYFLKVPHRCFRDIDGHWSDSTEVKVALPTDESLSVLNAQMTGVDRKYIVDLLDEKRTKVQRSFIIEEDCTLVFPYLKPGKYSLRITDDGNRNSIVDTGDLLQHRQPESVYFVKFGESDYLDVMKSAEVDQTINIAELFGKR
ncbi:MAG: Ig-like domain-containing protein [Bacteroidales bacterium]|nr:Ig-like domain-containing protein [Bacteroidales bacterium]